MRTDKIRDAIRPTYRRIAATLPPGVRRHYLHDIGTGSIGNFRHPTTFNEKVNWRILNDRRQVIADACDKLKMKDTAREQIPSDRLHIAETYWAGSDLSTVPDEVLGKSWVAKPNHSSGQVVFGPKTRTELIAMTTGWLNDRQSGQLAEWGYSQARRQVIIEERLPCDHAPTDYKFFVFQGEPRMIQVNQGRFTEPVEALYTPSWETTGARDVRVQFGEAPRPVALHDMLDIASTLGAGWDFIRVDLYCMGEGDIWFGELSPYPGGGVTRWRPKSFNAELGRYWQLPK